MAITHTMTTKTPRTFNCVAVPGWLEAIDEWIKRQPGRPLSRSEAIRMLSLKAAEADMLAKQDSYA